MSGSDLKMPARLPTIFRMIKSLSFDAKAKKKKDEFKASTAADREFFKQLKKVAQASGHIVDSHADGPSLVNAQAMQAALDAYAEMITPWATRQAAKMLNQVSKSNKRAYNNKSKIMGKLLRTNVFEAEVGKTAMALLNEQVALIKSIPKEAGLRAQKIASDAFFQGTRAQPDQSVIDYLTDQMGLSTQVAVSRAKLIARTETARANASFVQARAQAVGAKSYIWRTSMDGAERTSHREMNGERVFYNQVPTLSDGTKGHAGTLPNCRCYQDAELPDLDQ